MADYVIPVIAIVAIVDFGVQWCFYILSAILRSERFFDLIGSLTFITLVVMSLCLNELWYFVIPCVQAGLVVIWALRLGSFLVYRIWKDGKDRRFDEIKASYIKLFITWTFQGVWVYLTLFPTFFLFDFVKFSSKDQLPGPLQFVGWAIWLCGFVLEVVADQQKLMFKQQPENRSKFISHGAWKYIRHPNYLGEIILWLGLYLSAVSLYTTWWWILVALVGPFWVIFLLGFFSLRMLEKSSDDKYGSDENYQEYKARTKNFIPFIY
jgi:steroid 5-alpha reductase family enzyme